MENFHTFLSRLLHLRPAQLVLSPLGLVSSQLKQLSNMINISMADGAVGNP